MDRPSGDSSTAPAAAREPEPPPNIAAAASQGDQFVSDLATHLERWRGLGSASRLVGDQMLLFIFVDDEGSGPWTPDLRAPVEGKIESGLRWLEGEARNRGVILRFQHACVPTGGHAACDARSRIDHLDYRAGPAHSGWQNQVVAGLVGRFGSVASRWDDLFRASGLVLDGAEGSALFFLVRRYANSVAFRFFEGEDLEFEKERGIIYDNGGPGGQIFLSSQIAHEILHLYGAVDFAPNKERGLRNEFSDRYHDDVMHTPTQRPLSDYEISDLTAYLVGWTQVRPVLPWQRHESQVGSA